ncbi:hypothetical protein Trydic_g8199 [Trypoxylus dichotomus]
MSIPKLVGSIAAVSGKHVHPKTVQNALRYKGYRNRNLQTSTRVRMNSFEEESYLQMHPHLIFFAAIPAQKFGHVGGSVMVWAVIGAAGVGHLAVIDDIMDRYLYISILEEHFPPSVDGLGVGRDWIFLQDNDPDHTACLVKD